MKKLFRFVFVILAIVTLQLQGISIAEYIKKYSMPHIYNGILDLDRQNITDLTGLQSIPNKDQVHSMVLSFNELKEIPKGIFNGFSNLEELHLNHNRFQSLPDDAFSGLNALESLVLHSNELETLPTNIFSGLNNLRKLSLWRNSFSSSFMPYLIEAIHNIPNDEVEVAFFSLIEFMPKDEIIKRLARLTAPHLLRRLPSDILKYYNIEPLE